MSVGMKRLKASVERKEVGEKEVLDAREEIVTGRFMKIYRQRKKS